MLKLTLKDINFNFKLKKKRNYYHNKFGYFKYLFYICIMKVGQFEILDTAGWDVEKELPDYDHHVGQRHPGFLSVKGVETYGKELFKTLFGEGWTLKVEKRF